MLLLRQAFKASKMKQMSQKNLEIKMKVKSKIHTEVFMKELLRNLLIKLLELSCFATKICLWMSTNPLKQKATNLKKKKTEKF
jgi:hypothetical protein